MPPRPSRRTLSRSSLLVAAALLGTATSSKAANITWTGATGATWGATTSWVGGFVPTGADDLTILGPGNVAGALTIDIAASASANSINITDTSAVTISNTTSGANQTLTIGAGGVTTGAGAVTIGGPTANQAINIALGANQTWNIGGGGLTVSNVISGTGFGITKTGTGTLTLSGANTYTGTTTVSAGVLTLNGTRTTTSGTVLVSGGELNIQGDLPMSGQAMSVGNTNGVTGTVNHSAGTLTFGTTGNALLIGVTNAGAIGVYNLSGGTITMPANGVGGRGVIIGVNTGAANNLINATFNLSGAGNLNNSGSLQVVRGDSASSYLNATYNQTGGTSSNSIFLIGGNGAFGANSIATWTVTGGTFSAAAFTNLSAGNSVSSTMNIGGTAVVTLPAFPTTRGTGATATLNFNGGTLKPLASSTAYLGGLTNAFIKAGGASFDTNALNITVNQVLRADTVSTGGGLTKSGTGTLTLSGLNTYTGVTTVNGGTLSVSIDDNLGAAPASAAAGRLIINGGSLASTGTFTLNSNRGIALGSSTASTGGTIDVASAQTLTYGGVIANNGGTNSLTKTGAGILTLTGPNTYSGVTTINGGTLSANTLADSGSSSIGLSLLAGALTFGTNGGTLNFTGVGGLTKRAIVFTGAATFDIANGADLTLGTTTGNPTTTDGGWSGSGGTTKTGAGTLTLRNNGTSSLNVRFIVDRSRGGDFTMQAGTLEIKPSQFFTIGDSAVGNYYQTGGTATFTSSVTAADVYIGNGSGSGLMEVSGGTFILGNTSNKIRVGAGTSSGTLTVGGGAGTATVDANQVNVAESTGPGTLNLRLNGTLLANSLRPGTGTSTLNFDGGTLRAKSSSGTLFMPAGFTSASITANGLTTDTNTFDITIVQILGGAGGLTKSNTGTLTLAGANTYQGSTIVNGGTLSVSTDSNLGTAPAAATTASLVINGGTLASTGTFTLHSNRGIALGSSAAATGGTIDVASAQTLTYGGVIANNGGANSLTKTGAGTLTLSGANTYTGATTVSEGTLLLGTGGTGNAIASGGLTIGGANNTAATVQYTGTSTDMMGAGAVTINGRGILDFNGKTDTVGNVSVVSTGATTTNPTPIINTAGGGNLTIGSLGITPVAGLTSTIATGTGTLILGGNVTFTPATTGRAQVSGNLSLGGATRTFTVGLGTGATEDLLVDAVVSASGDFGITKDGAGRLTLSGANTFTGATTVSGGILSISGDGNLGAAPAAATTASLVINGGTLASTGTFTLHSNRGIALGSSAASTGGTIDVASAQTLTYGGVIANNGGTNSLTKTGAGTLTLSGANTYTGATTVSGGILSISGDGNLGAAPAAATTASLVINGGTLASTGTFTLHSNRGIALGSSAASTGGTIDVASAQTLTYGGIIANNGGTNSLTKTGAGILTLSGTNTYTGATTINGGVLSVATIGNGGAAGNLGQATNAAANLVLGGGTLSYTGATASTDRAFTLTGGTTSTIEVTTAATNLTISGASAATTGRLIKTGAGMLILSGANSHTGDTLMGTATGTSTGVLRLASNNALGSGKLIINNGNSDTGRVELTGGVTIANNVDFFGRASGTTGAIILNVSGNNTLSGVLTGGVNGTSYNFHADAGTLTISNRITSTSTGRALTLRGAGTINITGLIDNGAGTVGTNGINVRTLDAGTYVLAGANTYGGGTTVAAGGTVRIGNATALGDSAGVVNVASGAVLDLNGITMTATNALTLNGTGISSTGALINSSASAATYAGLVTLGSATSITASTGNITLSNPGTITGAFALTILGARTTTISSVIGTGAGTLTKNGSGTLTLSGANTFTGGVSLNQGTLNLNSASALGSGAFAVNGGTIDNTTGAAITLSGNNALNINADFTFTGTRDLNLGTGATTLGTAAGTNRTITVSGSVLTIGGVIANGSTATSLTKAGAGALTLSGTNTYTGATTVSEGTLLLGTSGTGNAIAGGGLTIGAANNTAATVQYTGASSDLMGAGTVTINGRGILDFNGKTDTVGNVSVVSTGATTTNPTPIINTAGGGNLTIGSLGITPVAGFTSVINSNTGTLTLGGNVTFTPATTGRAQVSGNLSLGGATRTFTVGLGTGATEDLLVDAVVSASGDFGITKDGAGRLTLSGANTYTGATTVSEGTLLLGTGGTGNAIAGGGLTIGGANNTAATVQFTGTSSDLMGAGTVTINGRGILDFNGKTDTIGNVSVVSTGATTTNPTPIINTAGGGNLTIGSLGITPVAGLTSTIATGTGTLILGGNVTFTPATTGRAQISGNLSLGGATRTFAVGFGSGTTEDLLVDAVVSASGDFGITKTGTGRLTLSGDNNYTGLISVSAGSLNIQHANALGGTTAGTTVSNGATLGLQGGYVYAAESLTLNTGSSASAVLRNISGDNTWNGTISMSTSGTNSHVVRIASDSGLLTLANTVTLTTNAANQLVLQGDSAILVSGKITGAASLTSGATGSGIRTLSHSANDYTGNTNINGGTLRAGTDNAFPYGTGKGNVVLNSGVFDLNGYNITINGLVSTNPGSVINSLAGSAKTLSLGGNDATSSFAGVIADNSGTGGTLALIKTGAGIQTLTGTNTYSGGTRIDAGTLTLGHATNTLADNGALHVNGGTLDLGANSDTVGAVTLTSGGISGSGTLIGSSYVVKTGSISAILAGAGASLTKETEGTITLSGANTYTGTTTLSAGTVNVGVADVAGVSGALGNGGNIDFEGGVLQFSLASAGSDYSARIKNSGSSIRIDTNGQSVAFAAALDSTNTGGLTKSGNGTLTLSGANTYTGATSVTGGALNAAAGALANTSGITVTGAALSAVDYPPSATLTLDASSTAVVSGANLNLTGAVTNDGSATSALNFSATTGTITLASLAGSGKTRFGRDAAITGGISSGEVTVVGALSADISGGTVNTGALTGAITGGTTTVSGVATISSITAGTVNLNGATSSIATLTAGTINLGTTALTVQEGAFTGLLAGSQGSLIKTSAGTLTLSGANTFGGGTTVSAGTLVIGQAGSLGSGAVTVASGASLDLANFSVSNVITAATGASIINGPSTDSVITTGTQSVNTVLTGTGGLTKADGGELVLTTPNFFTGGVSATTAGAVISAAHLADGSSSLGASALNDPTKLVLGNGATLEFTGTTATTTSRSFTVSGSAALAVDASAAALTFSSASIMAIDPADPAPQLTLVANNSGINRFEAQISDADREAGRGISSLLINGTGQWVIGGAANRFKGDVRMEVAGGATLGFESGALGTNATHADSDIVVGNGSTLSWVGSNNTDDISGRLSVPDGATAKLNLGGNNVTFASAPSVGTGGSLEKQGTGTLSIAAAVNAPTLNVAVAGGRLAVNGKLGNIALAQGAILGGSGTIGTATVASGATIAPGNSPGLISAESFVLNRGAVFEWEVQNATNLSGYDRINLTGAFDLSDASPSNRITLKIISRAGSGDGNTDGAPLNFGPPDGVSSIRRFQLGQVGSVVLGNGAQNISDVFAIDVERFRYSDGSMSNAALWSISWNAGTGAITLTAVPEPSTYGLGLGALALAAAALRRRRKQTPAA